MTDYDEATDQALDVVSVKYLCNLGLSADLRDDWGDYPELGEDDFREVVKRAMAIAKEAAPPQVDYLAAYDLLAKRAEGAETRPDDDPAPVASCNGKNCGGYPHE